MSLGLKLRLRLVAGQSVHRLVLNQFLLLYQLLLHLHQLVDLLFHLAQVGGRRILPAELVAARRRHLVQLTGGLRRVHCAQADPLE